MTMRRAVGVRAFAGPESLEVVELPVAEPGPQEVLIRVAAAAINPTDTGFWSGRFQSRLTWDPPYVPGMDAAGTIEAVGSEVEGLQLGDAVMAAVSPMRPEGGAYTELLTVPATQVIAVPDGVGLHEAATLPMNGLTAKVALDLLDLRPGQTLGVTGAAGVLGSYTIAMAADRGLRVVADAKPDDEELVRSAGADQVLPRGDDIGERMRSATDGGVDGLLDAALQGRAAMAGVRDGGRMVAVRRVELEAERSITLRHVLVVEHLDDRDGLELLRELAGRGLLPLRVAGRHAPEDAPEAHRRFAAGGVRGRLLITF